MYITVLNTYILNNKASKYIKQNQQIEFQGEIHKFIVVVQGLIFPSQ